MKLYKFTHIKSRALLVIVSFFIGTLSILAQGNTPIFHDWEPKTSLEIQNNDNLHFPFSSTNLNDPDTYTQNPETYIQLYIDNDQEPFTPYTLTLEVSVQPYLSDSQLDNAYQATLQVEFNPHGNTGNNVDQVFHNIQNRYGVLVSVISYNTLYHDTGNNVAEIPGNVNMNIGFKAIQVIDISNQPAPAISSISLNASSDEFVIDWNPISGALSYDLEWSWVDTYGGASPSMTLDEFKNNSTRINTKENTYNIPNVYSQGQLFFRVRAIGRFTGLNQENINYFGPWSNYNTATHTTTAHEQDNKNWQFQASYAEEGKKKEVVSYFDGTLRNRQTVTKINSDDNVIVGEVIYDNQGRPAIEVLPVPTNSSNKLGYIKDFNKNLNGFTYTHLDFDWSLDCEINALGMSTHSGASHYYSGQYNTTSNLHSFVPDAENYPFSQIEYTPDNTGRIKRKSGVGPNYKLDSNHEMKYIYAIPSQKEIDRLFGYHVGFVSHYKKNTVIDPNGQTSVSYIDPQGRTIATALAAESPDQLDELKDAGDLSPLTHIETIDDLLSKNDLDDFDTLTDNNELINTGEIVGISIDDALHYYGFKSVIFPNENYDLDYKLEIDDVFIEQNCITGPEGYPFVFNLDIDLTDDCGNSLLPNSGISTIIGEYSTNPIIIETIDDQGTEDVDDDVVTDTTLHNDVQLISTPLDPNPYNLPDIEWPETLPIGNMAIQKTLRVNPEALNIFANDYIVKGQQNECLLDASAFDPEATIFDCFEDCDDCLQSIVLGIYPGTSEAVLDGINQDNIGDYEDDYITIMMDMYEDAGLDQETITALEARFAREFELLIEACTSPCSTDGISNNIEIAAESLSCTVIEDLLLDDVAPYAQYGDQYESLSESGEYLGTEQVPEVISLYSTGNQLYKGFAETILDGAYSDVDSYSWQTPFNPEFSGDEQHYYDDNGQIVKVIVIPEEQLNDQGELDFIEVIADADLVPELNTETGFYEIEPQYLTRDAFIDKWEDAWAHSLIVYHPEYSYLVYSRAICGMVITLDGNHMNPDGFDNHINSLSFDDAWNPSLGFFNGEITTQDPFFALNIPNSLGLSDPNGKRNSVINTALNSNYENTGVDLLTFAYRAAKCNSIDVCTYTNVTNAQVNALTPSQKELLWINYRGNYMSLKLKIKNALAHSYASSHQTYNNCIEYDEENIGTHDVGLNNTYNVDFDFTSQDANSVCNSTLSSFYQSRKKRYISLDVNYNSGDSNEDIASDMEDYANAEYFIQEGICPKARDLGGFLDQSFKKTYEDAPSFSTILYNGGFNGNYLSIDLFEGLIGNETTSVSPYNNTNVTFSNGNDPLTLDIFFNSNNANGVPFQTHPITLSLPANFQVNGASANWDDYADGNSGSGFIIKEVHDFYYENYTTDNGGQYIFIYQIIADVYTVTNGVISESYEEVILSGSTNAAVGECSIDGQTDGGATDGSGNPIGDVLPYSDNGWNCTYGDGDVGNGEDCIGHEIQNLSGVGKYIMTFKLSDFNMSDESLFYRVTTDAGSIPIRFEVFKHNSFTNFGNPVNSESHRYFGYRGDYDQSVNEYEYIHYLTTHGAGTNADGTPTGGYHNGYTYNYSFENDVFVEDGWHAIDHNVLENPNLVNLSGEFGDGKQGILSNVGTQYVTIIIYSPLASNWTVTLNCYDPAYTASEGLTVTKESSTGVYTLAPGPIPDEDGDGEDDNDIDPCFICIPQPVVPVDAEDMYQAYLDVVGTDALTGIIGYTPPAHYTLEYFRDLNYQYVVSGYQQYINIMDIANPSSLNGLSGVEHPNFINIATFGATALHFGFNYNYYAENSPHANVIPAYKDYVEQYVLDIAGQTNPEPMLTWSDFVDYYLALPHNSRICPPASMRPNINIAIDVEDTCTQFAININEAYGADNYAAYLERLKREFKIAYTQEALQSVIENLDLTYFDKEYQYTLYYYDQAGNLTQTVPPEGVKRTEFADLNSSDLNDIRHTNLEEDPQGDLLLPQHTLKTKYKYNSLNQLVWQQTPDGGITKFAYDALGRIVASQNAKQAQVLDFGRRMSYTKYDGLGRIIEAGEINTPTVFDNLTQEQLNHANFPDNVGGFSNFRTIKTEVTKTFYDDVIILDINADTGEIAVSSQLFTNHYTNFNSINRVTAVLYFDEYEDTYTGSIDTRDENFDNGLFYNYDVHGNVKEMVTLLPELKLETDCTESLDVLDCEPHIKRVHYDYDLISGNVNQVTFQPNKPDQFMHKYAYDDDNRITNVETSKDGCVWENDAAYQYYEHGPLARVELGDKNVQGMDYAYTLQGWLKAVNGESIADSNIDIGNDGIGTHANIAKDAMAYALHYNATDYVPVETNNFLNLTNGNYLTTNNRDLYNGNIKTMITALRDQNEIIQNTQANYYKYDQLNRIKAMTSDAITDIPLNSITSQTSYSSGYSFDRNGNLETLERTVFQENATPLLMDNFSYDYIPGTNQLTIVDDAVANNTVVGSDIDSQVNYLLNEHGIAYDVTNTNTHNYTYDAIGQLVQDKMEGLSIDWRVDGKVDKIVKQEFNNPSASQSVIKFKYDGLGNRISKSVYNEKTGGELITYYSRDAQGNPLGVYQLDKAANIFTSNNEYKLKEHMLYGSSRLGVENADKVIFDAVFQQSSQSQQSSSTTFNDFEKNGLHTSPTITFQWEGGSSTSIGKTGYNGLTFSTDIKLTQTNTESEIVNLNQYNLRESKYDEHFSLKVETLKDLANDTYALRFTVREEYEIKNTEQGTYSERGYLTPYNFSGHDVANTGLNLRFDYTKGQANVVINNIKYDKDSVEYPLAVLKPTKGSVTSVNNSSQCTLSDANGNAEVDFEFLSYGFDISKSTAASSVLFSMLDTDILDNTDGSISIKQPSGQNVPASEYVIENRFHTDIDNDGVYDYIEDLNADGNAENDDTDGDGTPNYKDTDDDGDGVLTSNEINRDTNNDGVLDYLDTDDDGDGWDTLAEGALDDDNDGIANYLDNTNYENEVDGPLIYTQNNNEIGDKRYELSNHLGNVLNVITDKKIVKFGLDQAVITTGIKGYASHEGANITYIDSNSLQCYAKYENTGVSFKETISNSGTLHALNFRMDVTNPAAKIKVLVEDESSTIILDVTITESNDYEFTFTSGNANTYKILFLSEDGSKASSTFYLSNYSISYFTENTELDAFLPDVIAYNDYYPFGMLLPNRHGSIDTYRYGFNGMEKDDEISGEGNSYDFGERMYNPRVGRWFSLDAFESVYPSESPYHYALNNPMVYIDSDGNLIIDENDNPIYTVDGYDKKRMKDSEGNVYWVVFENRSYFANDGTRIEAMKYLGKTYDKPSKSDLQNTDNLALESMTVNESYDCHTFTLLLSRFERANDEEFNDNLRVWIQSDDKNVTNLFKDHNGAEFTFKTRNLSETDEGDVGVFYREYLNEELNGTISTARQVEHTSKVVTQVSTSSNGNKIIKRAFETKDEIKPRRVMSLSHQIKDWTRNKDNKSDSNLVDFWTQNKDLKSDIKTDKNGKVIDKRFSKTKAKNNESDHKEVTNHVKKKG